jgi:hypothetical protein
MKILKVCYIHLVEKPMIHIMTDELPMGKYYYYNLRTGAWNFPHVTPEMINLAKQFLGVQTFEELIDFRGQKLSAEAAAARDELTAYIREELGSTSEQMGKTENDEDE